MGSSYFGEPNLGNERSGSSRKGKKSNSDKPKQPQRGLGVAQLEKIRLHSQMGSSYLPSLHGPYPTNLNQEDMRQQAAYSSVPSASSFSYTSSSSSSYGFHGHQNATERDLGCIKPIPKMLVLKWDSHANHHYHQDYHHHMLLVKMGFGELERANIIYSDSQPSTTARWNPGNAMIETQHFAQPSMTRHFQNQQVEDSLQKKRKKDRSRSTGSSSQNSESSDTQELDLELRLSL